MTKNTLYYGDNLDVLRRYIPAESVDLVYLDPPFNSARDYNVLFEEQDGTRSAAQITAFDDTWRWDHGAALAYTQIVEEGPEVVSKAMQGLRMFLGESDMMAYLSMMAPRLVELRRVMKTTASIYLHCDPGASHYLKVVMDSVFGPGNARTEVVWKRTSAHSDAKQGAQQHGRVHDILLFYTRSSEWEWNSLFTEYDPKYVGSKYPYQEEGTHRRYGLWDMTGPGGAAKGNPQYEVMGITRFWRYSQEKMEGLIGEGRVIQPRPGAVPRYKRYLDEMPGVPLSDVWTDISPINSQAQERLGYPTQKPQALLERIISSSSDAAGVVLDPFCGCGTTIAAAQKLGRRWIGMDITHLAINLIKHRLFNAYGDSVGYEVIGEPVSVSGAAALALQDRFQFESWALGLVKARPVQTKKGADKGIDGRLFFHDEPGAKQTRQIILSVKSGKPTVVHMRDLGWVVEREKAAIGVLITLQPPTGPMVTEAASAGFYDSQWGKHPRLQILTIEELLDGARIDYPPVTGMNVTYKQAPRHLQKVAEQLHLDDKE